MREEIRRLKEKGLVITPQRLAVLECLSDKNLHLSAEEIYRKLKQKYPTLSLATVYTALEALKKAVEIQELNLLKGISCYDPRAEPHHHFFCENCHRILNIEISCPVAQAGFINGHYVKTVQACFYGICAHCVGGAGRENVQ